MENSFKFIKDTFLKLTSKTYPYGCEAGLVREMTAKGIFPKLEEDAWGNFFYKVGNSKTIFASHLDTVSNEQVTVKHKINRHFVTTDGTSTLGADDKAGVTILLWMIRNKIPGLYYFFIGEEVGCIGSEDAAVHGDWSDYDRIISFDKRGYTSIVTYQSGVRCCSDEFAHTISKQLNLKYNLFYKIDDNGGRTDSYRFISKIPECTNIAVGYANEHTTRESQDLYHLNKLALSVLDVKWEDLPISRNKNKIESRCHSWYDDIPSYNNLKEKIEDASFKEIERSELMSDDDDDDFGYGWGSSKKNNYLNGYEDYDDSTSRHRKTRRGDSKRTTRHFMDNANGKLTQFDKNSGIFDVLKDKFLSSDLTKKELESVRDQYLDMTDPYDRKCFDDLNQVL